MPDHRRLLLPQQRAVAEAAKVIKDLELAAIRNENMFAG